MHTGNRRHKNNLICIGIGIVAVIMMQQQSVSAQRPSFAGSRPAGGLSQRDKYNAVQGTAAATPSATGDVGGIVNRFGQPEPEQVTLAFGAVQRPPTGVSIVLPVSQYQPIGRPTAPVPQRQGWSTIPTQNAVPQFSVDNRIGENIGNSGNQNTAQVPQFNTSNNTGNRAPAAPALQPLDAHGDQALIDHLSRLPVDKQPFWFINYQAIEAQRNSTNPSVGGFATRGSFAG